MTLTTTDRINGINGGVAIKAPVRVATTANITLSGTQTVDGVALAVNDRVLVKNQTSGVDNGIYVVSTSAWQRDLDFNGINDVVTGTVVYVVAGTTNTNSAWQITTTGEITPGTTSITFAQSANLSAASAFMLTLLDDTTAAAARTTLGLGALATAASVATANLDDNAVTFAKTATQAANTVTANATGSTAVPAALSITANTFPARSSTGNIAAKPLTDFALTLLDDADAATARATLGVSSGLTLATPVATTSGTSVSVTGIPSGVNMIIVTLNGVSTNGTSRPQLQIGDSGGLEVSGYTAYGGYSTAGSSSTTGFPISDTYAAADLLYGTYTLTRYSGDQWGCTWNVVLSSSNKYTSGAGMKTLSATLDRVGITTVSGADTFDAGAITVAYL